MARAPDEFTVALETSQGPIELEVHRDWAPRGADRFYSLVKQGFYNDQRFFRVRAGYIAQFGISGDPAVARIWKGRAMADDSVRVSNVRGTLAYAMTGPNTRPVFLPPTLWTIPASNKGRNRSIAPWRETPNASQSSPGDWLP